MGCNKMLRRGESYKKFLNRTCANIFALQQKAQLNANCTFTLTHINLRSSANWLFGLSEFHGSLPHFPEPQRVSPLDRNLHTRSSPPVNHFSLVSIH